MADTRPIGIFDSGLGGLTVVRQLIKLLPGENLVYLGDTARIPYGTRSKETVTKFAFEDAGFLLKQGIKCVVIACNTASALAGVELKRKLSLPVFDVISPAIDEANKASKNGRVGVIGTRGTIGSGAYPFKYLKACPLFVPFIEEGEIKSPALELVAETYLSDFRKSKIDTLILGCTHYPIIRNIIEKAVGGNVKIVDPGVCTAKVVADYLKRNNLINPQKGSRKHRYYITDYTPRFVDVAEMFLGQKIEDKVNRVEL